MPYELYNLQGMYFYRVIHGFRARVFAEFLLGGWYRQESLNEGQRRIGHFPPAAVDD
jgi:hypothetical protein